MWEQRLQELGFSGPPDRLGAVAVVLVENEFDNTRELEYDAPHPSEWLLSETLTSGEISFLAGLTRRSRSRSNRNREAQTVGLSLFVCRTMSFLCARRPNG